MLSTPKSRGEYFLASSLRDGLEDNDIRQVETLLSFKDADPNVLIPSHGISPFHLVIGNESEEFAEQVSKLFLRHGGDPNVRSVDGMTPVHVAAAWGRVGVLELLLANGGDPLCLDDEGRSPFHYAFDGHYYDAVATLGKYCNSSRNEEEEVEEPKYTLTLDKILVNKGNVVAEYVPSEIFRTGIAESASSDTDRCDETRNENITEPETTPVYKAESAVANCLRSDNITVRRYRKRDTAIGSRDPERCEQRRIENEKLLVGRIIRRLSSTLSSDSNSFNNDTTIIKREINNARTKNIGKKGRDFTVKKDRNFSFELHAGTRLTPRRKIVTDTSIISKSPNCLISTTKPKTPKRNVFTSTSVANKKYEVRTPPQKFNKPPESRAKSASSTPKKKRYSGRLYETHTIVRDRNEKLRNMIFNDRVGVPKLTGRTVREREKKMIEYSPDAAIKIKPKVKYGAKSVAVRLDERMYDEADLEDDSETSGNDQDTKPARLLETEDQKGDNEASFEGTRPSEEKKSSFDSEEETKILLEIEEALEKRCSTPPASVSMLEPDDDLETDVKNFHSDYSSGESGSFYEFHEAELGTASLWSRAESFFSVDEEYRYEDLDEGIAFTERRLRVIPSSLQVEMAQAEEDNLLIGALNELSLGPSEGSSSSPTPKVIARSPFASDVALLREKFEALGEKPGPITKTTYNVYLKRLWQLERGEKAKKETTTAETPNERSDSTSDVTSVRTCHVPKYLWTIDWIEREAYYRNLEEEAFKEYAVANPRRNYRGGVAKRAFCYLLLDPRITRDMPRNGLSLSAQERWRRFLEATFYVGKGKDARPMHHLYDAFDAWKSGDFQDRASRKMQRILDIWQDGRGVVCLDVFSHTMSEEAYSREASMIEALGTVHLTNCVQGTYYGYATTMNSEEKRSLGKYLLYKSMEIFMHEGERQIFPLNVRR